ncbi:ATP-binding protein [Candidatus Endoriftia persephonae]|jgi:nitrogen-specific signal transduction histidine kinase|nr:ATP-binding protein [Candidatus Endoriftia persephone]USF86268.1 sensor histidine kinase [Candidatus Endoriftia persephone]
MDLVFSLKKSLAVPGRRLGLSLLALQLALLSGIDSTVAMGLLLVHLGFFLLWQPLLRRDVDWQLRDLLYLLPILICFVTPARPFAAELWLLLLIGLVSGRVFSSRSERLLLSAALVVLLVDLLLVLLPLTLFPANFSAAEYRLFIFLGFIPIVWMVLSPSWGGDSAGRTDFFHSMLFVLLVLALGMGAAMVHLLSGIEYHFGLAGAMLGIGLLMFALSFFLRSGEGLSQLWESYIFNLGTPFELWLSNLANIASRPNIEPETLLTAGAEEALKLGWVEGVKVTRENGDQMVGRATDFVSMVGEQDIGIHFFFHQEVGPGLRYHTRLLQKALMFFYLAHSREKRLSEQAHLRAIYETGARLTHDIKNILQAMNTVAALAEEARHDCDGEALAVVSRQLKALGKRLHTTLDKLRAPLVQQEDWVEIQSWWERLQLLYTGRDAEFSAHLEVRRKVPATVLTSISENLLENARLKRLSEPQLMIRMELHNTRDEGFLLRVCDSGAAVPEAVVASLFNGPVASDNGLGVGLYQSARIAQVHGFKLELAENRNGRVCFTLKGAAEKGEAGGD